VTVRVSLLIIVFGIAVGLALALLRSANFAILNAVIIAYIDVLRTLPQLVVIVFIYFGLPYLGVTLSPFVTTVLSLGMVLSAFSTEIFWSAIMAVPRGQWDAASISSPSFDQSRHFNQQGDGTRHCGVAAGGRLQ
jgi:His/Glu/Gln/Arg/opine family amino acid ABC transporter permease subunit